MKIRSFTNEGIREFASFLESVRIGQLVSFPQELLTDQSFTRAGGDAEIDRIKLTTRFQAARYLSERFARGNVNTADVGVWSWLAAFFFDDLCTVDVNGNRRPGAEARWIPAASDYRRYYRHLLAGPYLIFKAHIDNPRRAMALLCQPVHSPGDIVEQLASRQELITNNAVVELATILYVDPQTGKTKTGAGGKGPGSARRLAEVFSQFDVTWDLYDMSAADFASMLPQEFKKWIPSRVKEQATTASNGRLAAYDQRS